MTQKKLKEITGNASIQLQNVTSSITLRTKSNFAINHLLAACKFSRECGEIQSENLGKPLGNFFNEQIYCVSATVMLTVASLESNINEILSEPSKLFSENNYDNETDFIDLLDNQKILDKYQMVLLIKGLPLFKKGTQPFQDVSLLICLRNELVHFHPEWHDAQKRHKKIGNMLKGKFELSPFISEGTGGVLFPQRIISYGCTKWAVVSSIKFIDEFSRKLGIVSKLDQFRDRLIP